MADAVRRILIVKLADLGDLLLCEPAIRSMRAAFPGASIDLLVPPSSASLVPLLAHPPAVVTFPKQAFDHLAGFANPRNLLRAANLAVTLRRKRYEAVLLLHHLTTPAGAAKFRALAAATGAGTVAGLDNGRGAFLTHRAIDRGFGFKHEADYMLDIARSCGGADVDPRPALPRPNGELLARLTEPYVVIAPVTGAYSSARTWPVERFAHVARALRSLGWPVVLVGAADASDAAKQIQETEPDAVDLTARTSLIEFARVIAHSSVVISGDTFAGHLASSLDRPVVSIFGPSNDRAWRTWGSVRADEVSDAPAKGIVVRADIPCSPCIYTGYSLGRPAGCPARTCLTMVQVEDVVAAARRLLEAS